MIGELFVSAEICANDLNCEIRSRRVRNSFSPSGEEIRSKPALAAAETDGAGAVEKMNERAQLRR